MKTLRYILTDMKHIKTSFCWYYSFNFQFPSYLAVSPFLTQKVTRKNCRSMQLLGSSLKFHNAVTPVCITVQRVKNTSKVNTTRYVTDRKFSRLSLGTILFTFHCVVIKR